MLIYNYQKEFIGIDEGDLKTLGFANLAQLRAESADFADLFVRTPGYIHNFKHVHWIDFIACADPSETSKVIIDVNGKTLKASLSIEIIYMTDSPSSKAYLIQLHNLKALSNVEIESISTELAQKPTPMAAPFEEITNLTTQIDEQEVEIEDFDAPLALEVDEYDLPQEDSTPIEISQEEEFIPEEEQPLELPTEIPDSIEVDDFDLKEDDTSDEEKDENFDYDYQYNPQVASDELGLPIDLIEEFIQDFIAQANEFHDDLYVSLKEGDIDNVKILSHKLKGVAANLRIEDAFNILTVVNTSPDPIEIKSHLNTFYKIIAKLSGKEIKAVESNQDEEVVENEPAVPDLATDIDFNEDSELKLDFDKDIEIKEDDEPALKIDFDEDIELDFKDDLDLNEDIDFAEDIELKEDDEPTPEIDFAEEPQIPEVPEVTYSKELTANEIGLDRETFNELFDDFIAESQNAIEIIDTNIEQEKFSESKKEAIKLKGMSENMRLKSLVEKVNLLLDATNKDEMTTALSQIKTILEQISKQG